MTLPWVVTFPGLKPRIRVPYAAELRETGAESLIGDGEVALVVGAAGFGLGTLSEGVD